MPHIGQEELLLELSKKNPPVVIDVRTGFEFSAAHIKGARNIPFYSIFTNRKRLPENRHYPLVLTCEHGPRAYVAKLFLWLLGYRNMRYLEGHMTAWKANNMPTV